MSATLYHRNNFHKNTFCIFNEVDLSQIGSLRLGYKSKSGSSYYFTETGVYRLSNHWGRAANCKWRLQSGATSENRIKLGFALWSAFHRDNDSEKLYFIEVSPEHDSVSFEHKDNGNYDSRSIVRTASETTKRVRQIRNLLENDAWTKYYPDQSPEKLKEKVVLEMIQTDKTIQQIKTDLA